MLFSPFKPVSAYNFWLVMEVILVEQSRREKKKKFMHTFYAIKHVLSSTDCLFVLFLHSFITWEVATRNLKARHSS